MNAGIETKLRAARTRLCMDKPFLGALVVHLPFERAGWCRSVATDARALYFNPQYVEQLSFAQTQFVLAHTALHCALGHFARRGHRLRRRWDVACDYAVNGLLVDDGLRPPADALIDAQFRGMAAEEIYPLIPGDTRERPLDHHAFDGVGSSAQADRDSPDGSPLLQSRPTDADATRSSDDGVRRSEPPERPSSGESPISHVAPSMDALLQTWQMRLAAAAQQAQHAGCLTPSWQRAFARLLEPRLPWRALLARYLAMMARDDYSFQRPSR